MPATYETAYPRLKHAVSEIANRASKIGESQEEGLYEVCAVAAIKELIAGQIKREMKAKRLTTVMMARRVKTSRTAIDRLLDPGNVSVTLVTLMKAAAALGKDLRVELV